MKTRKVRVFETTPLSVSLERFFKRRGLVSITPLNKKMFIGYKDGKFTATNTVFCFNNTRYELIHT